MIQGDLAGSIAEAFGSDIVENYIGHYTGEVWEKDLQEEIRSKKRVHKRKSPDVTQKKRKVREIEEWWASKRSLSDQTGQESPGRMSW